MAQDIFGNSQIDIQSPIISANGIIDWSSNALTSVGTISIGASRPTTRRHTIGNQIAVIIPGQTAGQIQFSRLEVDDSTDIFSLPGWDGCSFATISVTFSSCDGGSITLVASGCTVSAYGISADAESNTIMDNVSVDFMQLSVS